MGLFSRFSGSRWSLQIREGSTVRYRIHQDSVIRIVAPLAPLFLREGNPPAPWCLHLHQNRKNRGFDLDRTHFPIASDRFSDLLRRELSIIDPKWNAVRGAEPVAVDARTGEILHMFSSDAPWAVSGRENSRPAMATILWRIFRGDM